MAFTSAASNLVTGDSNGFEDVFVRDRKLHRTYLVSVDSAGVQGNNDSYDPVISADGRYVAFVSTATNLVPGDTNGYADVFVRDLKLHRTSLVSVDLGRGPGKQHQLRTLDLRRRPLRGVHLGCQQPGGRRHERLPRRLRARPQAAPDLPGERRSRPGFRETTIVTNPAISADGRYVAFESDASNLVAGDTNGYADVFVRDRKLHRTSLVSVDSAGVQGNNDSYDPAISANSRYVAFDSNASDLVAGDSNAAADVFVRGPY